MPRKNNQGYKVPNITRTADNKDKHDRHQDNLHQGGYHKETAAKTETKQGIKQPSPRGMQMWRSILDAKSNTKRPMTQNRPDRNKTIRQQTEKERCQVPASTKIPGSIEHVAIWKARPHASREDLLDAREKL